MEAFDYTSLEVMPDLEVFYLRCTPCNTIWPTHACRVHADVHAASMDAMQCVPVSRSEGWQIVPAISLSGIL